MHKGRVEEQCYRIFYHVPLDYARRLISSSQTKLWCEWSCLFIIVTCGSWLMLICVDGHTLRHKGLGSHTHLPVSLSLPTSLSHLCSFISIALLPCFLSPCHVQSLYGWASTQSGKQGAEAQGRELPNRRQVGHWNDSNNGVSMWTKLTSQLAEPGWRVISVWCLQAKRVWKSTANPRHSGQAGAPRQALKVITVEQDVRLVLICVMEVVRFV